MADEHRARRRDSAPLGHEPTARADRDAPRSFSSSPSQGVNRGCSAAALSRTSRRWPPESSSCPGSSGRAGRPRSPERSATTPFVLPRAATSRCSRLSYARLELARLAAARARRCCQSSHGESSSSARPASGRARRRPSDRGRSSSHRPASRRPAQVSALAARPRRFRGRNSPPESSRKIRRLPLHSVPRCRVFVRSGRLKRDARQSRSLPCVRDVYERCVDQGTPSRARREATLRLAPAIRFVSFPPAPTTRPGSRGSGSRAAFAGFVRRR